MIPYEIADISTLEELNVEGNVKLDMVTCTRYFKVIGFSVLMCRSVSCYRFQRRGKVIPIVFFLFVRCIEVSLYPLHEVSITTYFLTSLYIYICIYSYTGYFFRMEELSSSNNDLIKHAQFLEQEQLNVKVCVQ